MFHARAAYSCARDLPGAWWLQRCGETKQLFRVNEKTTVNITCADCDGRQLCAACRNAARVLAAAGYRSVHSARYDALRAAAAGNYAFDACIVPLGSGEQAVLDAAGVLFAGKRVAIVHDGELSAVPPGLTVLERSDYIQADFRLDWLAADSVPAQAPGPAHTSSDAERRHAGRRLKSLARRTRRTIVEEVGGAAKRLDLGAVLNDEIAWAQASDEGFGLLLLRSNAIADAAAAGEDVGVLVDAFLSALSRAVRRSDVIASSENDFLIVLPGADGEGTQAASERIAASAVSASLAQDPARALAAGACLIGSAVFPADGLSREPLLERAGASLRPLL